jgi:hypothetical protein
LGWFQFAGGGATGGWYDVVVGQQQPLPAGGGAHD